MSSDKSQAAQRQLCPAGRDKRVLSMGDTSKSLERLANACASELKPSLLEFFTTSVAKYANLETCAESFCNFLRDKKLREKDLKQNKRHKCKG